MGGLLRLFRIALAAALLALVAAAAFVYGLASRSLPDYSGERAAPGLVADVEILRDQRAVPHIFAGSERDAYFALGYAHAQDRLWQMELRRRFAQGRLTELVGFWGRSPERRRELLRLDVTARTLDLEGRAARSLERFDPEIRALLAAYAAGVNAWLGEVDRESLGRGAPELLLLGAEVAPWRPVDSVTAFKLLAASRSMGVFGELERARFLTGLGPERAADLFPNPGGPALLAPPGYGASARGAARRSSGAGLSGGAPYPDGGSNAWAAAGARSATRAPLFAVDPHLPLSAPGLWYAARLSYGPAAAPGAETPAAAGAGSAALENPDAPPSPPPAPTRRLIGATVPGIPAILYGRNAKLAWGATGLGADVGDVFIEQLDPADPTRYRTPEGWAAFQTREAAIPIGDGRAVAAVLRESRHGPVLPLDWPQVAAATPEGHVAAISWTALAEDDTSLPAAIRLSRAQSVAEGLAAAAAHIAPPQTLFLADRGGVAAAAIGRVPLRRAESLSRGERPASGWSAENDWAGWLEPWALPRAVDPPGGLVANANNRISNGLFPRHLGHDWAEPYRLRRLVKLLNNREFHTLSGFQSIQNDTVSEMARAVLPLMARRLWAERARESGLRREALDRLAAWTGDMDAFLAEPLIFSAWGRALTRRLTADDLAPLGLDYPGLRPGFLERVYRDPFGVGARWCDDVTTPDAESCEIMASLALDDAIEELREAYGGSMDGWRWGRAHQAVHRHRLFGDAPALSAFLNIAQETGGGDHTLQRGLTAGAGRDPYSNISAGGFRAIYDFADLDRSVFSLATGQSGHFLSRHYDDFAGIWRAGDYVSMSLQRRDAEAGSVGLLRLAPPAAPEGAGPEG